MEKTIKSAVFGGGCFWCLEPIFAKTKGVTSVVVGYAGGVKENPTYEEVHSGETGHAEVVRVEFDPSIITYDELVKLFFASHDATTLNRQMHEVGPYYRSIILYSDADQQEVAEKIKENLSKLVRGGEVITEIVSFEKFYVAEEDQQEYFEKNPEKSSCCAVSGSRT
ncbi:peptide-methionine (S)-S-oxide reductase MsrA [Patescibacteria group bacterium]